MSPPCAHRGKPGHNGDVLDLTHNPEPEETPETAPQTTPEVYLTVDEAAAELRCGRDTVVRLIQAGRLPAKDLGIGRHHSYRIKRSDLELLNVAAPAPKRPARRRARTPYTRLA